MEVRRFHPHDIDALYLQPAQADMQQELTSQYAALLMQHGDCWTATQDGKIIACIGILPQHPGYAKAWAFLDRNAGVAMLSLTRKVRQWLHYHNPGRIDTPVDCGFEAGIRWAELLGFAREGIMRRYVNGRDCFLYAQIKVA